MLAEVAAHTEKTAAQNARADAVVHAEAATEAQERTKAYAIVTADLIEREHAIVDGFLAREDALISTHPAPPLAPCDPAALGKEALFQGAVAVPPPPGTPLSYSQLGVPIFQNRFPEREAEELHIRDKAWVEESLNNKVYDIPSRASPSRVSQSSSVQSEGAHNKEQGAHNKEEDGYRRQLEQRVLELETKLATHGEDTENENPPSPPPLPQPARDVSRQGYLSPPIARDSRPRHHLSPPTRPQQDSRSTRKTQSKKANIKPFEAPVDDKSEINELRAKATEARKKMEDQQSRLKKLYLQLESE